MPLLSMLNPKRAAASQIAKDMAASWDENDLSNIKIRLRVIKADDPKLHDMVVKELERYDLRLPVDS